MSKKATKTEPPATSESDVTYTFRRKNGIGDLEVHVSMRPDGTPVALLPGQDEWLDGDLSDLAAILPDVLAKMEELKQ
jgi:hypothetical protein